MLVSGKAAPRFRLPADDGTTFDLAAHRGQNVVLFFYPKDSTPGCTVEARDFTALVPQFLQRNTIVVGISRDAASSHQRFREKQSLSVGLLSDVDQKVHQAYGAWGEKVMYGKKVMGVIRSTFLIDPQGDLQRVWSPVKVVGHAEAVLAEVGASASGPAVAKKAAAAKKPLAKKAVAAKKPLAKKAVAVKKPVAKKAVATKKPLARRAKPS